MISAFQSSLSGLRAFEKGIASNANNVANQQSESFKKTRVLHSSQQPTGVKTSIEKINTPGSQHYEKTNNGTELIELSNVDLGQELPKSSLNATFYKANLKTMQVADEMGETLLNLKA